MIKTPTWHLVDHTRSIEHFRCYLEERRCRDRNIGRPSGAFTDEDRESVTTLLGLISPWLEALQLNAASDRVARILGVFDEDHDEYAVSDILITQLEVFIQTLEDELHRHAFFYLPHSEVRLYESPLSRFPETVLAFPSAKDDIVGACQCYALGQGTASVFHSMGILQYGLYALAADVGVQFDWPMALENWMTIIEQIESKIRAMEKGSKSEAKDQKLKSYSETGIQFRYFKDAWRNHVCHLRQTFDIHQAQSVLTHVSDFMEKLSERLPEIPIPSLTECDLKADNPPL